MSCEHNAFLIQGGVEKHKDENGVTRVYICSVTVQCSECGERFGFIGVPVGSFINQPGSNVEFNRIRLPITPLIDKDYTPIIATDKKIVN